MRKAVGILVLFTVVLSMILVGCTQQPATPTTPTANTTPQTTTPPASGGTIKIGHIRPLTGNLAATSNLMVKAFDIAFEQINYTVAGKKIEIIIGDSQGTPATAVDVARKMVENDKVAMVVGAIQVNENLALAAYMNQVGIPHIFTTQVPMDQIQNNKWTIGAGGTPAQVTSAMGVYAYDKLGYKKVDILTQDTTSGRTYLAPFMNAFKKKGGELVQEQYTTFPCPDFAPYLTVLKSADAVVAWTNGADAIKLLNQYHELGIDKTLPLVGAYHGAFLAPQILKALAPANSDATLGYLVPTPYSPLLDNAVNKQFVPLIQSKMNLIADDTESAQYQAGLAIIAALKATNGDTTPAKLRDAILNANVEGPEGTLKFDQQTLTSIKTIYICKIVKDGANFIWQPVFNYPNVTGSGL